MVGLPCRSSGGPPMDVKLYQKVPLPSLISALWLILRESKQISLDLGLQMPNSTLRSEESHGLTIPTSRDRGLKTTIGGSGLKERFWKARFKLVVVGLLWDPETRLSVMCSLVDDLRNWFCIVVGWCIVCHKSSFPVIFPPIASA
ncbi:hypothetical protein COLO4_04839 [Corchorus olitorius]|uniref:Uncharacterized protein n=1 Tax=Corchorus olitorius TaxID=93759 RepID=A0A1R3KSN7_9ROSI|nr:hypothetical protein COLO4_04839 [Corchorus olitorius]